VGRPFLLRFAALAAFLVTVALALWLAELSALFVGIVMAVALLIAWTAEWVAWREERRPREVSEGEAAAAAETEAAAEVEAGAELEPAGRLEAAWQPKTQPAAEAASPPPLRPVVPAAPAEPTPLRPVVPVAPAEPTPAAPPEPPPPPLLPVPPPPEPVAAPPDLERERAAVVSLPRRPGQRQEWNLWEIERLVRERLRHDPERFEESQYLLLHLRSFASADGSLPTEFDDLVRESFGGVLQQA
jgi:outer membrane biosynthesis protein TonB